MNKTEFVREAPIYYALAIAVVLARSSERITKSEITRRFLYQLDEDDPDTQVNLLSNEKLWDMGIEWLRQRGMVDVKKLSFGPPVFSRSDKFSEQWHELTSRGDYESAFSTYGKLGDAERWLNESLVDIYQETTALNIAPQDFVRFSNIRPRILDRWNEPEHRPVSDPPSFAEHSTEQDILEAIQGWFFENFEDPAQSTPYNSQEGGYLFIHGGPYHAREIVEAVFGNVVSDDLINETIEQIEHESDLWVPNSARRIPPDDDLGEPPVEYLHGRMRKQIDDLEALLNEEPPPTPGIGHNQPPEGLELSPFKDQDKQELSEALQVLKGQPPRTETPEIAQTAIQTLKSKAKKLIEWTGGQARIFAEEAIKEAGKQTGKWMPRIFWAVVLDHLLGIAQQADVWLNALSRLAGH